MLSAGPTLQAEVDADTYLQSERLSEEIEPIAQLWLLHMGRSLCARFYAVAKIGKGYGADDADGEHEQLRLRLRPDQPAHRGHVDRQ
jgi:hypothetical protein